MVCASTGEWYCIEHAAAVLAPRHERALHMTEPLPQLRRVAKEQPFPNVRTLGRCPDCGKTAPTIATPGRAIEILEHGCLARPCSVPGCVVARLPDDMVQFISGAWYCPSHALLQVFFELLAAYRGNRPDLMAPLFERTVQPVLEHFGY